MGVCCIIFDIDGMLFECCMNFLNIEKKIEFCFSIFHVFFTFYAIFFLEKHFFLILFRVLCYFQHCIFFNIEKCPFTYWLNGRWFLQIV